MRKMIFNYLVGNDLKTFIAIAFFLTFGAFCHSQASTYSADAGVVACPAATTPAPVWGKLVLVGNTVTCYYARGTATPTTWIQIGLPKVINFINDPILVGMYITSHTTTTLITGKIDNFSITPSPSYRLADYDIGSPAFMGSANLIGGIWYLAGSGADIGAFSDQCNFQSWLVWGDCTVICRVTNLISTGDPNEKIGIMIRDGFNSGSDYALWCIKNGSGTDFAYRVSFNNNPDITEFVAPPAPGVKSGVAVGYGLTGGTTYTLRP
jgi:hypothetical protein